MGRCSRTARWSAPRRRSAARSPAPRRARMRTRARRAADRGGHRVSGWGPPGPAPPRRRAETARGPAPPPARRRWNAVFPCCASPVRKREKAKGIGPRSGSRPVPSVLLAYVHVRNAMALIETTTAPRRRLGVAAEHPHYKWWALSCTSLGMLLATINSGTLIIALPDLERSLGTSLLQLVWVILVYMIASTVLVLTAGRLADLFGRKKAYVGGFLVFALASLGAGFAGGGTELILWRIAQGVGGAFLFANSAAIVTDAFPREQLGLAMGTNTMVAAVGLVIGPVLGGALVAISWHWVFWFNVPLGIAGSLWAAFVLHELASPDPERRLDLLGTTAYVLGLTGLVLGISKAGLSGWSNGTVIVSLIVAVVLLPLFVLIEMRQRAPMLDLGIFRNRLFAAAAGAAFINGLSRFALMFVFVFYYQGAQGDDPITAGIKLAPLALGMLVASPLAGIYADRHGSRALSAGGMLVSGLGLALMTTLQAD